jgi:hypothetical protein
LKQHHVTAEKTSTRFGEEVIRLLDPDGLLIELIASSAHGGFEPWPNSPVAAEHALRGFHSVSAALEGYQRTARLLTESFGYRLIDESGDRFRFASADSSASGRIIDLLCEPDAAMGRVAAGSVHHMQQQQSLSDEELQDDKSDIIKEYDRLVKSPEARRELEKQNPGLVAARDQAIVELRREKLQKETAERQHKVARVRR